RNLVKHLETNSITNVFKAGKLRSSSLDTVNEGYVFCAPGEENLVDELRKQSDVGLADEKDTFEEIQIPESFFVYIQDASWSVLIGRQVFMRLDHCFAASTSIQRVLELEHQDFKSSSESRQELARIFGRSLTLPPPNNGFTEILGVPLRLGKRNLVKHLETNSITNVFKAGKLRSSSLDTVNEGYVFCAPGEENLVDELRKQSDVGLAECLKVRTSNTGEVRRIIRRKTIAF
ncbi:hypothetical protein CSKR_109657, partial [Clonorchis sinensis]